MKCHYCTSTYSLALVAIQLLMRYSKPIVAYEISKEIVGLSHEAAILSDLTYDDVIVNNGRYETFEVFSDPDDVAIVAKKDGYCYAVYRGTRQTFDDWMQNFDMADTYVCDTSNPSSCCVTRRGFNDAFSSFPAIESALQNCVTSTCGGGDCAVIAGHSQGGAIALNAACAYSSMNPIVITFGQPPTMERCSCVDSDRVYRYVNTKTDRLLGVFGAVLEYDTVSGLPLMGDDIIGHGFILADNHNSHGTQVAYKGLDTARSMDNLDLYMSCHDMVRYLDRMNDLYAQTNGGKNNFRAGGFTNGSPCGEDYECQSRYCDSECMNRPLCKWWQWWC